MPLLNGSPLAVPEGADLNRAWQEVVDAPDPAVGTFFTRKIPGETFEQLLSLHFALFTSAAPQTRSVFLRFVDPNGQFAVQVPASAGQGPSLGSGYSGSASNGQTYNVGTLAYSFGIPQILLAPGWAISIQVSNMAIDDQLSQFALVLLRIPTGSGPSQTPDLAPTPMIV